MRRRQRRKKSHQIARLEGEAPQAAVSETIARGLCQNPQKNHHREGLQKSHLPLAKEVEVMTSVT